MQFIGGIVGTAFLAALLTVIAVHAADLGLVNLAWSIFLLGSASGVACIFLALAGNITVADDEHQVLEVGK